MKLAPAFTPALALSAPGVGRHLGLALSPAAGAVLSCAGPAPQPGTFMRELVGGSSLTGSKRLFWLAVGLPDTGFGAFLQCGLGGWPPVGG